MDLMNSSALELKLRVSIGACSNGKSFGSVVAPRSTTRGRVGRLHLDDLIEMVDEIRAAKSPSPSSVVDRSIISDSVVIVEAPMNDCILQLQKDVPDLCSHSAVESRKEDMANQHSSDSAESSAQKKDEPPSLRSQHYDCIGLARPSAAVGYNHS